MAAPKPNPKTKKQVDEYKDATYDAIGLAPLFLGEIPAIIFAPRKLQGFDLADALSAMSRGIFEHSKKVRMQAQKAMPPVEEPPDAEDSGPEIVG